MITQRLEALTRPTGEEEQLTVDFERARMRVDWKTATAAAVVLALAVAAVLFKPPPQQAQQVGTSQQAGSAQKSGQALHTNQEPSSIPPTTVVVAVVGAVAQPGLVTLAPEARIADALEQARPLPDANLASVNLAERLTDGTQINVKSIHDATHQAETRDDGIIHINTATAQQLTTVRGIGEKTAEAIIAYRNDNGPFASIEELANVRGIGAAKLAEITPQVAL